jgi:phosphoribosylamine--glycine ligase
MKILVIGSGGREHAMCWRARQDKPGCQLHAAPGNAGIASLATCHAVEADDIPGLLRLALRLQPDLVLVGPEAALASGLVDILTAHGIRVFGPVEQAARLETSKAFAKSIMRECGVPTAPYWIVHTTQELREALKQGGLVVKVDGLAAGKGVTVARDAGEAFHEGTRLLETYGPPLVVEAFVKGREVSVLALCDGAHAIMLPSAQDHKRLLDGDRGPNTGGMGAVSPGTHHERLRMDEETLLNRTRDEIIEPVLEAMRRRGVPFVGVLYAGLMVNPEDGSLNVLEFNARLGDPEAQVLLPRVKGNFVDAVQKCIDGRAEKMRLGIETHACVCVVMANEGYPGDRRTGDEVNGLERASAVEGVHLFHAGTEQRNGHLVTSGGRVLCVSAGGESVAHALDRAYSAVSVVQWPGVQYRRDVGRTGQ